MNMATYPTEVTVIVNSVKNIKAKKKGLKYCVIFSVGSVKFRTDLISDDGGCPEFNTESSLQVDDPKLSLVLLVTEKKEKEFFGQLVIALDSIPSSRGHQSFSSALEPHKKCPRPTATINYEVWISKDLPNSGVVLSMDKIHAKTPFKGFKKTLANLKNSPMLARKSKYKLSLADGNMKQSQSCLDLYNNNNNNNNNYFNNGNDNIKFNNDYEEDNISNFSYETDEVNCNNNNNNLNNNNNNNNNFIINKNIKVNNMNLSKSYSCLDGLAGSGSSSSLTPDITGISPNCGIITGGTRITIRGSRLGNTKEDIIGLFICGSNVLSSLEFHSSCKVVCTSKPWKLCSGPISIETQSGGKYISELNFTFKCDEEGEFDSNVVRRAESLNNAHKSKSSTNLNAQFSPPAKKSSKFSSKLTIGLSNSFLSRSLMNLNDNIKDNKKVNRDNNDENGLLRVDKSSYGKSSYNDLASSSRPPHPPVVYITPIMQEHDRHKTKEMTKIDSTELKELEQQLFTWQKCANNLTLKTKELEDENQRLKVYIDNMVSNVLVKCPDVLCKDGTTKWSR